MSIYIRLLLSIILLVSFLNMIKVMLLDNFPDFNIYYYAAEASLDNKNPYLLKGEFVGGYIYPPISLIVFYPFVALPLVSAAKLWTFASILMLLVSVWLLTKMYDASGKLMLLAVIGILIFNYFPVKFTLGMGQFNMVILLLLSLMLYAIKKGRNGVAGIFLGATLILKYFPIFILLYLLVRRKWKILISTVISATTLFALGVILITPEVSVYFLSHTLPSLSGSWNTDYYNQALTGFLGRGLPALPINLIMTIRLIIIAILLGVTLWVIGQKPRYTYSSVNLEISVFITLSLLLNAFAWQHHFVLLIIPFLMTYFTIKESNLKWYYYVVTGICFVLVAINFKDTAILPTFAQSHVFYGALGLWILDVFLIYRNSIKETNSIVLKNRSIRN